MSSTGPDFSNPGNVDPIHVANAIGALLGRLGASDIGAGDIENPAGADITTTPSTPVTPTNTGLDTSTTATPGGATTTAAEGSKNPLPSGYKLGQPYGAGNAHEGHHPGVDLEVAPGTTAVAAISGKITQAGLTDPGGYGNLVEITGANGIKVRYGHLSYVGAKVGQTIKAGQPIGKTGGVAGATGSGNSTGPHLHFEVDLPGGGTTDPMPYLAGGASILSNADAPSLTADQPPPKTVTPIDAADTGIARLQGTLTGNPQPSENAALPEPQQTTTEGTQADSIKGSGDPATLIHQAMQITGVPQDWFPALYKIMMRESGGQNIAQQIKDVNTAKGTPAFGPMQIIQPTFNAHKMPGHEDWHNPLDSTIAAIRYIIARYGRPEKAAGPGGY